MIEVRLMQRLNKSFYIEVKLRSEVKPKVKALGIVEQKDADMLTVAALAGALAEHLGERYGDTLDPEHVAKKAAVAYRELMAEARPNVIFGDIAPATNVN